MPQEIHVPDFSKRLTTSSGRIEHNNPGPGERTSIGPEDRALLMEKVRKALTEAMAPATIPPPDAEVAAVVENLIEDVTASSPVDSTVEVSAKPQEPTSTPSPESPEPHQDEDRPLPVVGGEVKPASGDTRAWGENTTRVHDDV